MLTAPNPAGTVRHAGGCLQPVLLRGHVDHIDGATGELLHRYTTVHEPGGVLPIACKTRRVSQCPPCAEVYRADTYQLIRAGLSGGKGIPATVANHPCVFATLTAPSFGPVHARREKNGLIVACHPRRGNPACPHGRPQSCKQRHGGGDVLLGEPLCPGCYGYTGSVLFNACAPELWRRFTITLGACPPGRADQQGPCCPAPGLLRQSRRIPAPRRGPLPRHHPARRPAGPDMVPPSWATLELLTAAITQAARAVHIEAPPAAGMPGRILAWGHEHDIRPVSTTGDLNDTKVAAYVAKYATKAAECTGTLDRRITPADPLADLPIREHARRLIAECIRLSKLHGFGGLRLAAWAHMLGFSAHFSSRTYSTTLGALRADRARHQHEYAIAAGLWPDPGGDTVLVLSHWSFTGRGQPPVSLRPVTASGPGRAEHPDPPGGDGPWT